MPLTSKVLNIQACWRLVTAVTLVVGFGWATGALANSPTGAGTQTAASSAMTLEEGLALARAQACLGCHQVDKKRVGPSFKAIAQRHANKEDAVPYLVQVIRKGGRGQWGAVPMPGQSVSQENAEKLAHWILSLGK